MVSGETAESVKRFMLEFMLPHAVVFYSNLLGQSMVGHNLRKIAELCLLSTKREITTRDMLQGFVGWRHLRPQDQEICLQQLVDHGWIMPHPSARMSLKGAPTRYLINPHCVEVHAQRRLIEMDRRQSAIELLAKCSQDVRDLHAPT
jgi:hypothetical protein